MIKTGHLSEVTEIKKGMDGGQRLRGYTARNDCNDIPLCGVTHQTGLVQ